MEKTASGLRNAAGRAARLLVAACVAVLGLPLGLLAPAAQADEGAGGTVATKVSLSWPSADYELDRWSGAAVLDVGESIQPSRLSAQYVSANADQDSKFWEWTSLEGASIDVSSSDSSVAYWDGSKVIAASTGTAEVTFSYAGDSTSYKPSSYTAEFEVYAGSFEEGGYTCRVSKPASDGVQGEVRVTQVAPQALSTEGALVMPSTIEHDGQSYGLTFVGSFEGDSVCSNIASTLVTADLSATSAKTLYYAFRGCSALESIQLPGTLMEVGASTFYGCSSLASVALPSSVERLGDMAFNGCTSLANVVIPTGVTEIPPYCFSQCSSLVSATLPDGLERLDAMAFYNCSSLASVSIPASVTTLCGVYGSGDNIYGAFSGCSALETVEIPEDSALEDISDAFAECSSLKSLYLPAKVSTYSYTTFRGCTSLAEISVSPDNESFASEGGYLYDKNVTRLIFAPVGSVGSTYDSPLSVVSVEAYAFMGNTAIERVRLNGVSDGSGVNEEMVGESAFQGCTSLTSVTFPGGACGVIGARAFSGCSSLRKLDFSRTDSMEYVPGGTTRRDQVYSSAFYGCSALTSVTLPPILGAWKSGGSMKGGYSAAWHGDCVIGSAAISDNVFGKCTSLEKVVFKAGCDEGMYPYFHMRTSAFTGCTALKTIVYEGEQAYWLNPNKSMQNGTYSDAWESCGIDMPDLYYSIDYYATADKSVASGDNAYASKRFARVEYKRGASVNALSRSDAEALSDYLYTEPSDYAEDGYADGAVPDANAVAANAGLDTSKEWRWKLGSDQQCRSKLTDSTYAYLVPANDLSDATLKSATLESMQFYADRMWTEFEDGFDAYRYLSEGLYKGIFSYSWTLDYESLGLSSPWLTSDSSGTDLSGIAVTGTSGEELNWQDSSKFDVSWQLATSANADGTVATEATGEPTTTTGLYLMTITPKEGSGYDMSTSLREWVLVQGPSGSAKSLYAETAMAAVKKAQGAYASGGTGYLDYRSAPYCVSIGVGDETSTLIASGLAGVVKGGIDIVSQSDSGRASHSLNNMPSVDLALGNLEYLPEDAGGYRFGQSEAAGSNRSASEIANAVYEIIRDDKGTYLGSGYTSYSWAKTALLCVPSEARAAEAAASYAYAAGAPVFFAEEDGTLSKDTLALLGEFDTVLVVASDSAISTETMSGIASAHSSVSVERVASDIGDACGLSIELARRALAEGAADESIVGIADATQAQYFAASLNLSGFQGGISLASCSTADSKRVVSYLKELRDHVSEVWIFAKDAAQVSSDAFDLESTVNDRLWDYTDATLEAGLQIGTGDTIVVDGVQYEITGSSSMALTGEFFNGTRDVALDDTVSYNGVTYDITSVPDGYKVAVDISTDYSAKSLIVGDTATGTVTTSFPVELASATSNREDVAIAELDGSTLKVTAVGQGRARITVASRETDRYKAGSTSFLVSVGVVSLEDEDLGATVYVEDANCTGEALEPEVNVEVFEGDDFKMLERGTDYEVAYSDNVHVGTGTVTVTGIGRYTGTLTENFEIGKGAQTIATGQDSYAVAAGHTPFSLEASAQGELAFSSSDEKVATVDADGVVTPLAVGSAAITITAQGTDDFDAAEKTVRVTVGKAAQTVKLKKTKATKTYKAAKKGAYKKKLKKNTAISAAKLVKLFGISAPGKLAFAKANKAGKAKIKVSKTGKVTLKKGLKKGTYKIKVKVSAAATSVYAAAPVRTVTLTVKVK